MLKTILFVWFCVRFVSHGRAQSLQGIITFANLDKPCSCPIFSCKCCLGINVNPLAFSKTVCVDMELNFFPMSVDVTIQVDNKTVASFNFSEETPPSYCIPVLLQMKISLCIKMHDLKLSIFKPIQMCVTIYAGIDGVHNYTLPLSCAKLTDNGLVYYPVPTNLTAYEYKEINEAPDGCFKYCDAYVSSYVI